MNKNFKKFIRNMFAGSFGVLVIISMFRVFTGVAEAGTYQNHQDGSTFCININDVEMTSSELAYYLKNNTLDQEIIKRGNARIRYMKDMSDYEGSFAKVDYTSLLDAQGTGKKAFPVELYVDGGNLKDNSVVIEVYITFEPEKPEEPDTPSEPSSETSDQSDVVTDKQGAAEAGGESGTQSDDSQRGNLQRDNSQSDNPRQAEGQTNEGQADVTESADRQQDGSSVQTDGLSPRDREEASPAQAEDQSEDTVHGYRRAATYFLGSAVTAGGFITGLWSDYRVIFWYRSKRRQNRRR